MKSQDKNAFINNFLNVNIFWQRNWLNMLDLKFFQNFVTLKETSHPKEKKIKYNKCMVSVVMIRNIPKCHGVKSIPSTHMYLKNNFVFQVICIYLIIMSFTTSRRPETSFRRAAWQWICIDKNRGIRVWILCQALCKSKVLLSNVLVENPETERWCWWLSQGDELSAKPLSTTWRTKRTESIEVMWRKRKSKSQVGLVFGERKSRKSFEMKSDLTSPGFLNWNCSQMH